MHGQWSGDREYRKAYDETASGFALVQALIEAPHRANAGQCGVPAATCAGTRGNSPGI